VRAHDVCTEPVMYVRSPCSIVYSGVGVPCHKCFLMDDESAIHTPYVLETACPAEHLVCDCACFFLVWVLEDSRSFPRPLAVAPESVSCRQAHHGSAERHHVIAIP
jgi:hypothetical protein